MIAYSPTEICMCVACQKDAYPKYVKTPMSRLVRWQQRWDDFHRSHIKLVHEDSELEASADATWLLLYAHRHRRLSTDLQNPSS